MDPIFRLSYSEWEAASAFSRIFKKKGFAILLPVSRQQTGFDFVVTKAGTRKFLRVQVKSSRAWVKDRTPMVDFWFRNFLKSYRPGVADLYVFLGVYPAYSLNRAVSRDAWETVLLVFHDREMAKFLGSRRARTGRADAFFGFGFDWPSKGKHLFIHTTRGAKKREDLSRFQLERRRDSIARLLGP